MGEGNLAYTPPPILHDIKVTHTHTLPTLKPQKLHRRSGVCTEDISLRPHAKAPCGSRGSLTRWTLRSRAPLERAAGGAHGLPQLLARGDSSEHLGDVRLAENLQELGP